MYSARSCNEGIRIRFRQSQGGVVNSSAYFSLLEYAPRQDIEVTLGRFISFASGTGVQTLIVRGGRWGEGRRKILLILV